MAPKSRKPSRREQGVSVPTHVPTQWSQWAYSEEHKCDVRYRLDSWGQYEYDYGPTVETSTTPQVSSVSSQAPQTTSDTQWGYADFSESSKRGRSTEHEEAITPRQRVPSISPTRPIKPGPNPAPQPPPTQPKSEPEQSQMMPTAYNSADSYSVPFGALSISPTETTGQPLHTSSSTNTGTHSNQYMGPTGNGGLYSSRDVPWNEQNTNNPSKPFQVTIKGDKGKARVTPTKGTRPDCFVSADFAEKIGGKRTKSKAQYYDVVSKKTFNATEGIFVDINPKEEIVRGVYLYIIASKSFKHSVILAPEIVSRLQYTQALDSVSSTSEDSGYDTGNGYQRPQQVYNMSGTMTGAGYPSSYPSQATVLSSAVPRNPGYAFNSAANTSSGYPSEQNTAMSNPSSGTGFHDTYDKGNDYYGVQSRTS